MGHLDRNHGLMPERLHCVVPHCRRSTSRQVGEWICGEHWLATPKRYRRAFFRARRRGKRIALPRHIVDRLWNRLKRAAIETGVGIG